MSIPNIDSLGKFFVFLGIATICIAGYFTYKRYQAMEEKAISSTNAVIPYTNEMKLYSARVTHLTKQLSNITNKRETMVNEMLKDKNKYQTLYPTYRLLSSQWDSINYEVDKAINDSLAFAKLGVEFEQRDIEYKIVSSNFYREKNTAFAIMILGVFFIGAGLIMWLEKENLEKTILLRQNIDKPTFSTFCQSCGKSFNSLILYGTENNQMPNFHFCNECYQNGKFNAQINTVEEMQNKVADELKTNKVSDKRIKKIIDQIKNLERWKKDHYKI